MERAKFYSIGKITNDFFSGFGISKTKEMERVEKEEDIDFEKFKAVEEVQYKKLEELIGKSLTGKFRSIISKFQSIYKELIYTELVVSTTQKELNYMIDKELIVPLINRLYREVTKELDRIIFFEKAKEDNSYLDGCFRRFLEETEEKNLDHLNIDGGSQEGLNEYNYIIRMRKNEFIPTRERLNELIENCYSQLFNIDEKSKRDFKICMFFSRYCDEFEKNSNIRINWNNSSISTGNFIERKKKFESEKLQNDYQLRKYYKTVINYVDLTYLDNIKKGYDEKEIKKCRKELGKSKYFYIWQDIIALADARYLVTIDKVEDGLKKYIEAMNLGGRRIGKLIKRIVYEGIILASYLEKKREFKVFYKYGYHLGLYTEPYIEENNWMLQHFHKKYNDVFGKKDKKYKKIVGGRGVFIAEDYEMHYNISKPNKKIEFNGRENTQLMLFSGIPAFNEEEELKYQEYIKNLIKAGAKIGEKNSTKETALIKALCAKNFDRALILLNTDGVEENINTVSLKNKNTVFKTLFEYEIKSKEEAEKIKKIIELAIDRGVDVNLECSVDKYSPLRILLKKFVYEEDTMRNFYEINRSDAFKNQLKRVIHEAPLIDTANKYDIENNLKGLMGNKDFYKDMKAIREYDAKNRIKFREEYIEILKLMVNNGADINQYTGKECHYNSPVLFATEIGDLEVFKIIDTGKNIDINQISRQGTTLLNNALVYKNYNIVEYLFENYPLASIVNEKFPYFNCKTFDYFISNAYREIENREFFTLLDKFRRAGVVVDDSSKELICRVIENKENISKAFSILGI